MTDPMGLGPEPEPGKTPPGDKKAQTQTVQYRYTPNIPAGQKEQKTENIKNKREEGKSSTWQLNRFWEKSKTTEALKQGGWGNKETLVKTTGDIKEGQVGTSSDKVVPLSSKGIMTDKATVTNQASLLIHGTVTFKEEVYQRFGNVWVHQPGMTTQITHSYDRGTDGILKVNSNITNP